MTPSSLARARRERPEPPIVKALERIAIVVVSLALTVGLIVLLSGYFAQRDQPGLSGTGSGPGQAFPDLGHAVLSPGQRAGYNSIPPTSGAHVPRPVVDDGGPIGDNQLLQALQLGDVVIVYAPGPAPAGLDQLAGSVAPPFSPALAASGQAVILATRSGTKGLIALAWTHLLRVTNANDPALRGFVTFWLGRGAAVQ